jgi:1,4-alpha-glucan branching enzyme
VDCNDTANSTISFIRKSGRETILVVCNFTPVPRETYHVGVPFGGWWRELLNSDGKEYGGTGWGNFGGKNAEEIPAHGRAFSLTIALPPLGVVFFKSE